MTPSRRTPRSWVVGAVLAALLVVLGTAVAGRVAFPDEPWVRIDRLVPSGDLAPTARLQADEWTSLLIDVPSVGLDRVDVRFHFSGRLPTAEDRADLELVDAGTRKSLWSSELALSIAPPDDWTSVLLPHVAQHASPRVELRMRLHDPDVVPTSLWAVPCDCVRMASWARGGEPEGGDIDAAYLASVGPPVERLRVIGSRINDSHPAWFGTKTLFAALLVVLATSAVAAGTTYRQARRDAVRSVESVASPPPPNRSSPR